MNSSLAIWGRLLTLSPCEFGARFCDSRADFPFSDCVLVVLHGLHLLDEAKSEEEFKFDAGGAEEVSGVGVDGSARLGLGGGGGGGAWNFY